MLVHGREGVENRKRTRHMWSVSSAPSLAVGLGVSSNGASAECFFRDGRKISIGDCALFKPAQDRPPFVGIIRSLTSDQESNLTLGVNRLYRTAEVKLLKGVALEAAPNEVFYSFHRDEIPAASLLHPCKVAFLRKGAELPAGVASFVCRRVYDITNKCFWWLSDRDFIDERQEEVDKLLDKTGIEMHASAQQQQSPRSKLPNISAATSPQKHSTNSVQNSSSNFFTKRKEKKRDRGDQLPEPINREQSARVDSGQVSSESFLNVEIAKVAERGGLVDSEAVARLVRLMQSESSQIKINLAGRSMLAGIIATTDNLDYLTQFIQLKGLVVLDEWLQEVHKGKVGDPEYTKDCEKSVENFLLVLLRALVKLPVNLNALQMCNIGKSVNYLRFHKNTEIQKKAKSLVDTWKKRVEAEMTIGDEKSGSSQAVPSSGRSKDGSHGIGGYRHSGGSYEAAIRNSVTHHSSLRSSSVKLAQGGSNLKFESACQSNARPTLPHISTILDCKNGESRISAKGRNSEPPQTVAREEKSGGSSQSHTNSQCSSDHVKFLVPCGKTDVKRFTASSKSSNKTTGKDTKHRKSVMGRTAGVMKETTSNRSSLVEKSSHNATDDSVHVGDVHEGKFFVNISNRVWGPAQSIVAVSADDSSCRNSRASPPVLSERHDKSDACLRGKHDSHQSDEVGGSLAAEYQRTSDSRRLPIVSKDAYSTVRNEMKLRKAHDSSFSSMDALIESCVKLLEAAVSMSDGDDYGMNLLASVAVGDFSNSSIVSPAVSPHKPSATAENSGISYIGSEKQLHGNDAVDVGANDCNIDSGVLKTHDAESTKHLGIANEDFCQKEEGCLRDNGISDEHVTIPCTTGRIVADASAEVLNDIGGDDKDECSHQLPASGDLVASHVEAEDKLKDASLNDTSENKAHRDTTDPSINDDYVVKMNIYVEPESNTPMEKKLPVLLQSESRNTDEIPVISSRTSRHSVAVNATINVDKSVSVELCDCADDPSHVHEKQEDLGVHCADAAMDTGCKDENVDNKEAFVRAYAGILPEDLHSSTNEGKFQGKTSEDNGAAIVHVTSLPATGGSDVDAKHRFDLNEGFNMDEGKHVESVSVNSGPGAIALPAIPLQVPVSSALDVFPTLITATAVAKGPLVPPDDLLKSKMELGWKRSVTTSVFHLAESSEVMELPLCPSEVPCPDGAACKQARPPLDIDLNVADESSGQDSDFRHDSVCELMTTASLRSSGGLDLDLNKIDEAPDIVQQSASNSLRVEVSIPSDNELPSSIFSNGERSCKRDFDLNDGPAIEETLVEQTSCSQPVCNNIPLQSSFKPRISSSDAGNLLVWNPPGMGYSVSVSPSALPDREPFPVVGLNGGLHRMMGGPSSSLSFYPDAYRGSVVATSLAMPFQSATYQYPIFPFGTSCPLPTSALAGGPSGYMDLAAGGRFSAIPSQLVGNAAEVSFQYPHAYGVPRPIQDVSNNRVFDSNKKWGKLGLDLNSGPGGVDLEWRNGLIPTVSRQVSAINLQPLVKEQARMYSMGGGILKRKEPDGGWNAEHG